MLKFNFQKKLLEAGCDEAGRGALAGPVVAAAVIMPKKFDSKNINDSKKISAKTRLELSNYIKKISICWSISVIDNIIIDKINILKSAHQAMTNAVKKLKQKPKFIIIDGNRFYTDLTTPYKCIIKGDTKYLSIASASIIAKTHRDEIMNKLHEEYPEYKWNQNKGYPTVKHKEVINKIGVCKYHRKSFNLFDRQYKLEL